MQRKALFVVALLFASGGSAYGTVKNFDRSANDNSFCNLITWSGSCLGKPGQAMKLNRHSTCSVAVQGTERSAFPQLAPLSHAIISGTPSAWMTNADVKHGSSWWSVLILSPQMAGVPAKILLRSSTMWRGCANRKRHLTLFLVKNRLLNNLFAGIEHGAKNDLAAVDLSQSLALRTQFNLLIAEILKYTLAYFEMVSMATPSRKHILQLKQTRQLLSKLRRETRKQNKGELVNCLTRRLSI